VRFDTVQGLVHALATPSSTHSCVYGGTPPVVVKATVAEVDAVTPLGADWMVTSGPKAH
jgi:hypothetical protein